MCSRESYNHVSSWLADARSLANPDIVIILVGNKKDKDKEREVTFLEASRFSQENGVCVVLPIRSLARSGADYAATLRNDRRDVSGVQRKNWRGSRRGVPQVCANDFEQDRLWYAHCLLLASATLAHSIYSHAPPRMTVIMATMKIGVLDPAAIGSGVQLGDAAAAKASSSRRAPEESGGCPC